MSHFLFWTIGHVEKGGDGVKSFEAKRNQVPCGVFSCFFFVFVNSGCFKSSDGPSGSSSQAYQILLTIRLES